MFETNMICDNCGDGFQFQSIKSKWFMIKTARIMGWSVGKKHLCPNCRKWDRRVGDRNVVDSEMRDM